MRNLARVLGMIVDIASVGFLGLRNVHVRFLLQHLFLRFSQHCLQCDVVRTCLRVDEISANGEMQAAAQARQLLYTMEDVSVTTHRQINMYSLLRKT